MHAHLRSTDPCCLHRTALVYAERLHAMWMHQTQHIVDVKVKVQMQL